VDQARYRGTSQLRYLSSYLQFLIRSFVTLTRRHLRERYDVIHVNNMPNFIVFSALVPRITGARVLLDMHDTTPEQFGERFGRRGLVARLVARVMVFEERISAMMAHAVICVHGLQERTLLDRGIRRDKLHVIMNLPDERIWGRRRGRGVVPGVEGPATALNGDVLMAFHGTLTRDRGVDLAIRALARLRDRLPGLRLLVIGDGDALPELRRLVADLRVEDRIVLVGRFLPVEELPPLLKSVDLGVLPSHAEWGLPTKLMEYVLLGVPCIAPRSMAISHYFTDEMVRFISSGHLDDLVGAIEDLAGSAHRRMQLAEAASRFLDLHSWESERLRYFACVDGALRHPSSESAARPRGG
jgi:glycosyltransferase involved in cell wall biosynthesis